MNFPIRTRCVLKAIIQRKNWIVLRSWESFFYKKSFVTMFQSMSALVHRCPESHKWTLEPTLNKKSQDCLECCAQLKSRLPVICLCALGQYITSSFLVQCCLRRVDIAFTGYFPHKHCLSAILANIVQVISLCSVGSDRSIQNCRLFSCAELFVDCGSTLQS